MGNYFITQKELSKKDSTSKCHENYTTKWSRLFKAKKLALVETVYKSNELKK